MAVLISQAWHSGEGNVQGQAPVKDTAFAKSASGPISGFSSEEREVLEALSAFQDLMGRPQRGSPGLLVYRPVSVQEVGLQIVISLHFSLFHVLIQKFLPF